MNSCVVRFGLESVTHDSLLPWAAVVSCLRTPMPLGPGETSRIQRMAEPAWQEEMARAESLYDTPLANAASLESADASQPVAVTRNRNRIRWRCLVGHLGVLDSPSLSRS